MKYYITMALLLSFLVVQGQNPKRTPPSDLPSAAKSLKLTQAEENVVLHIQRQILLLQTQKATVQTQLDQLNQSMIATENEIKKSHGLSDATTFNQDTLQFEEPAGKK
jgi:hypothetical protein